MQGMLMDDGNSLYLFEGQTILLSLPWMHLHMIIIS